MKPEMLQVQQYLSVHPILEKNANVKEKYVALISYFVGEQKNKDLWCKQAIKLYCDRITSDGYGIKIENTKDLSLFKQCKLFKYRYYLLTDCLFIACYDNQKKGQKVLESVITFYGERYRKKMECVFKAFYSVNDDLFTKTFPELKVVYSIIWKNRLFIDSPLKKIMITANMSAGKSTLINALAGKKVNKTQNDTCTAKLHYLYNKAGEDNYSCEYDHDLELDASLYILMTDNDENDGTDIAVGTRFRSVTEIDKHVCFVDTPGVNSSMDKTHREMSNEAIKSADCDLLLYLFNGENIGSDDDIRHLQFVRDNYDGNIIFLVNRLDHYKKDVDSVNDTLTKVIHDLKKIGFSNPTVYPISAYAGYLGKMALYGEKLSEDEEDDFDYVKRKLSRDEFSYNKHYPINVNLECKDKDIGELLLHSGILSLEKILYQ